MEKGLTKLEGVGQSIESSGTGAGELKLLLLRVVARPFNPEVARSFLGELDAH